MNVVRLNLYALAAITISALLVGCGGTGTTAWVPTALTPSVAHHATSSDGDLLYVTTTDAVVIVSYPQDKVVGKIPWYSQDTYICSDPNNGNVFIPQGSASDNSAIYEYAHGSTTPMATLALPTGYKEPTTCAVDPITDNLAVNINYNPAGYGALLVYPGGQGIPTIYQDKKIRNLLGTVYDGSGDVYATAFDKSGGIRLAEIPVGQSSFALIKFANCKCVPETMQWDGHYIDFEDPDSTGLGVDIDQLSIDSETATLVDSISLIGGTTNNFYGFWLHDGLIFAKLKKVLHGNSQGIGVWSFPSGSNPVKKLYKFTHGKKDRFIGELTLSVAPTTSRNKP